MSFKTMLNALSEDESLHALSPEETGKLKNVLLEAYIDIQRVCEQNDLTVMLIGGSTLGAVRHKGFIPWDDDMDIAMPRPDYEILKERFDELLGDRYILDAPNMGKRSTNRFPRILIRDTRFVELGMTADNENACIKLDVFIIENVPGNKVIRTLHGLACTALMYIAGMVDTYEDKDPASKAYMCKTDEGKRMYEKRMRIGKLFSFSSGGKWFDRVDRVCQYGKKSDYLGIPTGRKHYFGEVLPYEALLPASRGTFEGYDVNLPGNPDQYLKNLFGDYMQIPKEEDREKHFIHEIRFADDKE